MQAHSRRLVQRPITFKTITFADHRFGLNSPGGWALLAEQLRAARDNTTDADDLPTLDPEQVKDLCARLRASTPGQASIESLVSLSSTLLPALVGHDTDCVQPILDALFQGLTSNPSIWKMSSKAACSVCLACARLGPGAADLFAFFSPQAGTSGSEVFFDAEKEVLQGSYGPHLFDIQRQALGDAGGIRPDACCRWTRLLQYQTTLSPSAVGGFLLKLRDLLVVDGRQRIDSRVGKPRTAETYRKLIDAGLSRLALNLRAYWRLPETRVLLKACASVLASGFCAPARIPPFSSAHDVDVFIANTLATGEDGAIDLHYCTYNLVDHLVDWKLQQGQGPTVFVTGRSKQMQDRIEEVAHHVSPGWRIKRHDTWVEVSLEPTPDTAHVTGIKRAASDSIDQAREDALRARLLQDLAHRQARQPAPVATLPVPVPPQPAVQASPVQVPVQVAAAVPVPVPVAAQPAVNADDICTDLEDGQDPPDH